MDNSGSKLNLACGNVIFPGWINVDIDSPVADLKLDLTEPLPFSDRSTNYIFCEHFIEHVSRAEGLDFLKECHRVLDLNGVLRLTTPNLRFLIASYLADSTTGWGDLWQPMTRCQMMNEGMRYWGHQFLFDADELIKILREAGFSSIAFRRYHESPYTDLQNLESRPFNSELIVEAINGSDIDSSVDTSPLDENEVNWPVQFHTDISKQLRRIETDWLTRGDQIIKLEKAYFEQIEKIKKLEEALKR